MREVAIIGAGLVGSLWAVLLRQRGYSVTIYEKRPDLRRETAEAGRSINLVMTSRGLHALERAGLAKDALALSVPVLGRQVHPKSGESVFQPYGVEGECNYSISRRGLNAFLLDSAEDAGARIEFRHLLESVDEKTRTLVFQHEGEWIRREYDLVFGTDGASGAFRKQLVDKAGGTESIEWLEADYKELLIPAGPKATYRLEKNALHIWPRGSFMMMGLANLDGSFTATVYLPKTGSQYAFDQLTVKSAVRQLFETEFPDAVPLMPRYLEEFLEHPQGSLGTIRVSKWVLGDSMALIGDAAHAIVPFFGQGMNAGFEDCTTLAALHDELSGEWEKALAAYEKDRKPNADAIATMALENWAEMRDKVADPKFQLRKKVEGYLEKEFPTLYKSRYGMITYTLIPYRLAQEAGKIQDQMLEKLCRGMSSIGDIDRKAAERTLKTDFAPFLKKHNLDLTK